MTVHHQAGPHPGRLCDGGAGGHGRAGRLDGDIRLTLARPELVRSSRSRLPGTGSSIPAQTGVHPWRRGRGVYLTQAIFVIVLLVMAFLAVLASLAIRALKSGAELGRLGLIAVSGVAAVWAVMSCFDLATGAPAGLEPLLITVSALKRLGYLGLGAAVLILLVMPASRAFTRRQPAARHTP